MKTSFTTIALLLLLYISCIHCWLHRSFRHSLLVGRVRSRLSAERTDDKNAHDAANIDIAVIHTRKTKWACDAIVNVRLLSIY